MRLYASKHIQGARLVKPGGFAVGATGPALLMPDRQAKRPTVLLVMARLCDILSARRAEILHIWTSSIRPLPDAAQITTLELVDHLPKILDELTEILRSWAEKGQVFDRPSTSGKHGVQRFGLGFVIEAVIREYSLLHRCIIEMIHEQGAEVSIYEQRILSDFVFSGIAEAATEYSHQRDTELRRQANEHFAFLAHELRTPLASVQFALGSLHGKDLVRSTPLADVLLRGITRMNDLIEGALRLAIAREGVEPQRVHLRVSTLVTDAIAESVVGASDKEIRLEAHGVEDLEIDADERLMRSAMTNLLSNAVKFSQKGGTVRVRFRKAQDKVVIDVEDACGGLPPGTPEKMFKPFVPVGDDKNGFGLGLAIARQAVESHGGSLGVRNHPGEGCTMTIELPVVVADVERGPGA
jgi:signal transduction histidine kinase